MRHEEDGLSVAGSGDTNQHIRDVNGPAGHPEVVRCLDGQRLGFKTDPGQGFDEILTNAFDLRCPHHMWFLSDELDMLECPLD